MASTNGANFSTLVSNSPPLITHGCLAHSCSTRSSLCMCAVLSRLRCRRVLMARCCPVCLCQHSRTSHVAPWPQARPST